MTTIDDGPLGIRRWGWWVFAAIYLIEAPFDHGWRIWFHAALGLAGLSLAVQAFRRRANAKRLEENPSLIRAKNAQD